MPATSGYLDQGRVQWQIDHLPVENRLKLILIYPEDDPSRSSLLSRPLNTQRRLLAHFTKTIGNHRVILLVQERRIELKFRICHGIPMAPPELEE